MARKGTKNRTRSSHRTTRSTTTTVHQQTRKARSGRRRRGRQVSMKVSVSKSGAGRTGIHGGTGSRKTSHGFLDSATNLIDSVADFLKEGIQAGAKGTEKGRKVLKDEANDIVNFANRKLHDAVNEGAGQIRKGIKKL